MRSTPAKSSAMDFFWRFKSRWCIIVAFIIVRTRERESEWVHFTIVMEPKFPRRNLLSSVRSIAGRVRAAIFHHPRRERDWFSARSDTQIRPCVHAHTAWSQARLYSRLGATGNGGAEIPGGRGKYEGYRGTFTQNGHHRHWQLFTIRALLSTLRSLSPPHS